MDELVDFGFDVNLLIETEKNEHVDQYRVLEKAAKELIKGVAILGQGRLPQELFSDTKLKDILHQVCSMLKRKYPRYDLAADHISHYRDMKLVTFAVDQKTYFLVVSFPVFVKDVEVDPLSIYEIETVHVPIKDLTEKAQSYSRVRLSKPYIAVGPNAYIQLRLTELSMCKKIRYIYYCEELFVLKHKSGL